MRDDIHRGRTEIGIRNGRRLIFTDSPGHLPYESPGQIGVEINRLITIVGYAMRILRRYGTVNSLVRVSIEDYIVVGHCQKMKTLGKVTIGVLGSVALLVGCATDVANRYYGTERYSPKDVKEVELLQHRPSREFVVIADFQSRGDSPEAMRKRAAAIGADAVIVTMLGGLYNTGDEWAGKDTQANTYSRITGTAIKYK